MNKKGQFAMDYLLLIGGILLIAVLSIAVLNVLLPELNNSTKNCFQQQINEMQIFMDNCPDNYNKYELVVETETYNFYVPYESTEAVLGKITTENNCIRYSFGFIYMNKTGMGIMTNLDANDFESETLVRDLK